MARRILVTLGVVCALSAAAPALAQGFDARRPAPAASSAPASPRPGMTGIAGNDLFVRGRFSGRLDPERINCLGHAAGVDASVQTGTLPLGDTLKALGYSCRPDEPESLARPIAEGRAVMMIYLYTYADPVRPEADRGLTAAEMAKRYGWQEEPWRQSAIYSDEEGDLPFDFHAIRYDGATGTWDWVTHARPKDADGGYSVDSVPGHPATLDPDLYFPPELVIVKLACAAER